MYNLNLFSCRRQKQNRHKNFEFIFPHSDLNIVFVVFRVSLLPPFSGVFVCFGLGSKDSHTLCFFFSEDWEVESLFFIPQPLHFKWAFNEAAHEISSVSCENVMHSKAGRQDYVSCYLHTYTSKRFISLSRQIVKFSFCSCFVLAGRQAGRQAGLLFILPSLAVSECVRVSFFMPSTQWL